MARATQSERLGLLAFIVHDLADILAGVLAIYCDGSDAAQLRVLELRATAEGIAEAIEKNQSIDAALKSLAEIRAGVELPLEKEVE